VCVCVCVCVCVLCVRSHSKVAKEEFTVSNFKLHPWNNPCIQIARKSQ
jgi:hypothetical protein